MTNFSNELRLDLKVGYQDSSSSKSHEGEIIPQMWCTYRSWVSLICRKPRLKDEELFQRFLGVHVIVTRQSVTSIPIIPADVTIGRPQAIITCAVETAGLEITLRWHHNGRDSISNHQPPRHWPLCGEFTGDRWIPRTNGQLRGKCFHLTTSSWTQNVTVVDGLIIPGNA